MHPVKKIFSSLLRSSLIAHRSSLHLRLIALIGVIVPRRLRADWRQEWEAELGWREAQLAAWDKLNRRDKLALLAHSCGAFWDALWLQTYRWEDEMVQDLRYGLRILLQNPVFTVVAVLTLALAIGANTAIFSVVNTVLLRPLPYRAPEQLAMIRLDWRGVTGRAGISAAEVIDFRQQSSLFEGFEVINPNSSSLTGENMERVPSVTVSEGLFPLLGIRPFLGNGVSEKAVEGQRKFWDVVISYELWQRRFGGDREIIGRRIEVNNFTPIVVGVMPPGFKMHLGPGANIPEQIDLFFLGSLAEGNAAADRAGHDYTTITRLKPGVTFAQAQSEIDAIAARVAPQYPKVYENSNLKFHLTPLHDDLVRPVKPAILALLGAVGFVLLIACANVANLILARTSARAKELAVRSALGAGRMRIIRQLVTENLLLSFLGGAGGLLLAMYGVDLLLLLRPANLPRQAEIGIDGRVLTVTLVVSLITGVLLGLFPAWQSTKADVNERLKVRGHQLTRGQGRVRQILTIAEVGLSLILVVGAGLMMRTFANLNRIDWGFNPDHLLTLQVNLRPNAFSDIDRRWQFYRQVLDGVRAMPGVEAASSASPLPLKGEGMLASYALDEAAASPSSAVVQTVVPDYFRTLEIRMLAGRDFTPLEIGQKLPLVIIDSNFARRAWPNENPIGKSLLWRPRSIQQQWMQVIGVVEHIKAGGLRDDGRPQLYLPYLSYPLYDLSIVVRTKADPFPLAAVIKKEIENLGPQRPVHAIRLMNEYVGDQLGETRFALTLIGIFAAIALSLCLVGLYSVISYSAGQRTHEIGIRLALGAQRSDILRLILGQGMTLVGGGIAVGLMGALALTRGLESLLFGVSPTDPVTFTIVAVLLAGISLAACYLPARRATKVDPLVALRCD
jgi:putative ABC transport system permease protein